MSGTRVDLSSLFTDDPLDHAGAPLPAKSRYGMAARNALQIAEDIRAGLSDDEAWRFAILQTLDNYRSALKHGGVDHAKSVFDIEPPLTGSRRIDAAFAGLAEHLAQTDGWIPPDWVKDSERFTHPWFPDLIEFDRTEAQFDGVPGFRRHGILVTFRGISRA